MMMILPPSSARRLAGQPIRSLLLQNGRLLTRQPASHSFLTWHTQQQQQLSLYLVQRATTVLSPHATVIPVAGRHDRAYLSTTAAATASPTSPSSSSSSSSSANTNSDSNSSSSSNLILDHLGSIFLTAIGLVIATLVRSYYGTARKNALRDRLEAEAALDPLEMEELRLANSRFTVAVFRNVMEQLWTKKSLQQQQQQHDAASTEAASTVPTMTYTEFSLAVREILQTQHHRDENPIPTIELGHYLDRVVLKMLLQEKQKNQHQASSTTVTAASETAQSLTLWLIVLSLALSAPTPDRIQVLHEILQREAMATRHLDLDSGSSSSTPLVTVAQVQQLVGYLQSTCQLVIDNQLLATPDKKYPIQDYHQGSPQELVQWQQPGEGGDDKDKSTSENEKVDVEALAAILRSKSVCAWGECYHKKRML
jgi:hypothetical protein